MATVTGLSAPAAPGEAPDAGGPPADVHTYLEDPRMTGEGQEPPHAFLRPDDGERLRSLDGTWRFTVVDRPEEVPEGFWKEDYTADGWRRVEVPHTWQTDDLDHPVFRNVQSEIVPDDPPKVPRDVNPTGVYLRDVHVPEDWAGQRQVLRFDGVTSGWFLWVNGHYVGYDQGGYVPAEFDVTEHLRPGRNRVAVQVHRWSAGSYLEDYDQWRYAGIFRSVTLYSTPKTRMEDAYVTTDLAADHRDATLRAEVDVVRAEGGSRGPHRVTGVLYDPRGHQVRRLTAAVTGDRAVLTGEVADPALWSDEAPHLYTLALRLHGPDGRTVQATRLKVGFREVEVGDGQLKLNGKRVLIRGVNRAETDPDTGRHITRARMEQDIRLMKRLNVNAIRTSHYPSDPYLYDLADREGMLIVDEMEVETHSHERCPEDCLAERPEWQEAFLDRHRGVVERDKNHPSVIMWDTGNEAGLGRAHYAMAEWTRENEPTRPLYHQSNWPDGDAPFADVAGPRYPTPASLAQKARTFTKPIVMGEYAHAMGNSLGNFREFWEVVRTHPRAQGGFIWDWAEQNIRRPLVFTPDTSGNGIAASLSGKPRVVAGHGGGKALYLSGLDDFVEVYRDRRLDLTGTAVTLDARVRPAEPWTGDFTIVSKGEQYVLRMKDERTLEFTITSGGGPRTVTAPVPDGWAGAWHRVTGTYDGGALRLYADGRQLAETPWTGRIDHTGYDLGIGRNTDTMEDGYAGRTAKGTVDKVRVYDRALAPAALAAGEDPRRDAVIALDFDRFTRKGDYLSYGLYESGVDGLVSADRVPQPETAQLAWVLAPIRITDADARSGRVRVTSERLFTDTSDLELRWEVTEGTRTVASGTRPLDLAPGATAEIALPAPPANPGGHERHLTVRAVTARDTNWAGAGHTVSFGQFPVGGDRVPEPVPVPDARGGATAVERDGRVEVTGDGFRYTFDKRRGTLTSMRAGGRELLRSGPELDVWRAPISNERWDWGTAEGKRWQELGLDRLRTTVDGVDVARGDDGAVTVTVRSTAAAPDVTGASFAQTVAYRVDGSGTVRVRHRVEARGGFRALPYLPRVGLKLRVPQRYDTFHWYGRGPVENVNDRKDGTPMGVWSTSVADQYVEYLKPQDHGNHDDVRWAALTDGRTGGLLVSGDLEVAATAYDDLDRAAYPHFLKRNDGWHTLHADHAVTGVGDTPNPVREEYQVEADRPYDYTLTLRPLTGKEAVTALTPRR
ncbi:MAG TPA: glycoside hydrolase family 2 TIM barrel-domain containing protein [Streptomyces sp.]|uniref:glycoside hydrolase family 2 TIM barrel-domain containing protein n=1 Tax=Streptomyces sp. TaxID=1931 RepID=UPI002D68159A|nr:glycoside hydrolase family 2 TIM barrel-domain containing protein [Streptomyces sp.]HZG06500.1 glycoside hydrolase family 2 TIM barrel-domain containing protein [Streptomyces sp.]